MTFGKFPAACPATRKSISMLYISRNKRLNLKVCLFRSLACFFAFLFSTLPLMAGHPIWVARHSCKKQEGSTVSNTRSCMMVLPHKMPGRTSKRSQTLRAYLSPFAVRAAFCISRKRGEDDTWLIVSFSEREKIGRARHMFKSKIAHEARHV